MIFFDQQYSSINRTGLHCLKTVIGNFEGRSILVKSIRCDNAFQDFFYIHLYVLSQFSQISGEHQLKLQMSA